jgi:hypothetical protein
MWRFSDCRCMERCRYARERERRIIGFLGSTVYALV